MWGAAPQHSRVFAAIGTLIAVVLFVAPSSSAAPPSSATITAVSPLSGPVGSIVTITGTNFVNVSNVTFYDYPAPSWTVNSPTSITAVVPYGTPSPGRWRVITPDGTAVFNTKYTVTGTPTITSVSPMSGAVGDQVTITGSNFSNVTKVTFYDSPSPSWKLNSSTSITAVVPYGTPSPGRWRVVNPAYTAVYNPTFSVTGTPAITGVSPMAGPVGSTVTISGSNFTNDSNVTFYDYPVQSFTINSSNSITAKVPAGTPSPGRWRVVNPAYTAVYSPLFSIGTDATAPTAPTGLAVTNATSSSLTLSWNASSDNVGVTGYEVYRNGTLAGTPGNTSFSFSSLPCNTTSTFDVDALDAAGNRSPKASISAATGACQTGTGSAPPYRFMINSDQGNQAAANYGYNLLDVGSAAQADDLPAGTQGLIWVGDYDNSTCSWEQSDATVRATVTAGVGDPKVFGYYISDEPDPYACPNAYNDHRARSSMIHSIDPGHKTLILIDSNSAQQTIDQIPKWAGTADIFALDPYPCYQGQACNYTWIDQVIAAANSAGINYWGVVQAFQDSIWRWPTTDELNHMLGQWGASKESGIMTFAWTWSGNTLSSKPDLLSALNAFNSGAAPPPTDTTPPSTPTNFTVTNATSSSVSVSWTASTDNVGVTGYGLYKGGTLVGPATGTTATFNGLPCNTPVTLGVDATDAAGNRSGQATLSTSTAACPGDTTPPSTPTGLTVTSSSQTSISLSWTASTDNVGVTGYNVFRGSTQAGTSTSTSFTATSLTCGTTYSFTVQAKDAAGNVSGQSSSVSGSTAACSTGDTTPPSTPTGLNVTSTSQTAVSLSWTASTDNVGVTGYNVFRGSTLDGTSGSTTYTSTSLTCATSYTFTVQAKDAAGNVSGQSGSVNVTTDACSGGGGSSDPVITAAGDICGSSTDCKPTSDLVLSINPTRALTLGDNAYDAGTTSEYSTEYDPNWGRFKSITSPAPGNHEYDTSGATGYFSYFGSLAPAPYYSYDVGTWHLISLASSSGVSPSSGSAEETWLKQDLAAHPNKCVLAYWHEPRWSSGTTHGSDSDWDAVWKDLYAAHADVVLNGHEHNYERFAKQNPSGAADPNGIREFISGTGGASHGYPFGTPIANSQVRNDSTWGVLKLTLHPSSYDWQFVPIAGSTFTDSGTDTCS
jgi:chitodextrinase